MEKLLIKDIVNMIGANPFNLYLNKKIEKFFNANRIVH